MIQTKTEIYTNLFYDICLLYFFRQTYNSLYQTITIYCMRTLTISLPSHEIFCSSRSTRQRQTSLQETLDFQVSIRTTKAQTSLRIRAIWSAALVFRKLNLESHELFCCCSFTRQRRTSLRITLTFFIRTTKAQTSLRIRTVWLAPLFFASWKV